MPELSELIREYCSILDQERQLSERKEQLRTSIADEMKRKELDVSRCEYRSAQISSRFRLHPKAGPVLSLLNSEDLLFFANFTPARVKEVLVPKYGREKLIPLFDYEKTQFLLIKRPTGSS
jgi:hypothetical protein